MSGAPECHFLLNGMPFSVPREAWARKRRNRGVFKVDIYAGDYGALIGNQILGEVDVNKYFAAFVLSYESDYNIFRIKAIDSELTCVKRYGEEYKEYNLFSEKTLRLLIDEPEELKVPRPDRFVTIMRWYDDDEFDTVNAADYVSESRLGSILPIPSDSEDDTTDTVGTVIDQDFYDRARQYASPPPPGSPPAVKARHSCAAYYCLQELDDMKAEGLPALPFDDGMKNVCKKKRKLPSWARQDSI
jgi:hypothetical protein